LHTTTRIVAGMPGHATDRILIASPGAAGILVIVSTTRPGDEGDEREGHDDEARGGSRREDRERKRPDSPLDDLFVVGAKYHEPSAAERAAAAKAAERESKKAAKANEKEIARTRRVLDGDHPRHQRRQHDFSAASIERRGALLGFAVLVVISAALSFTPFGH
jgi:hypothetical protein